MTDRPIIFSGPMVRALLDRRKTQTRRLATSPLRKCNFGDRLYVRETFSYVGTTDPGWLLYKASGYQAECRRHGFDLPVPPESDLRWKPSIHMPRRVSRLTLTVTEVRFQNLQDIALYDILDEGVIANPRTHLLDQWTTLWNSLHTKEGERWEDNPEIVALTFTVDQKNIDQ